MIATILLVCILLALAATAYFPGNEGVTYRNHRHSHVARSRNPNKLDAVLGKANAPGDQSFSLGDRDGVRGRLNLSFSHEPQH